MRALASCPSSSTFYNLASYCKPYCHRGDRVHRISHRVLQKVKSTSQDETRAEQAVVSELPNITHTETVFIDIDSTAVVESTSTLALGGKFRLNPAEVKQLLQETGYTEDELLQALIRPASTLARPPISSFHVGAVGLGESGSLYVGVNLEFARLPLYNSVHAEQFLIVNAVHHGETGIRKLAVSAAPCGHCRQFFCELVCAETVQIMFQNRSYSLGEILPGRFQPSDLLPGGDLRLLLEPQDNAVHFTAQAHQVLQQREGDAAFQKAAQDAIQEARGSYAPYSRCPAGVSIVLTTGEVYSGGYIESAAYNPSIPPLQTAIIDAVIDGMPTYAEVCEVVLVELEGAPVHHAPTVRVILEQIAPHAHLTLLTGQRDQ